MHVPHKVHRWSPVEVFLAVFNPMRMASFLVFFGAFGRLAQLSMPWLGALTLIIGVIAGIIGSNVVLALFGFVVQRFNTSSASVVSDLIGHMAEVCIPVPAGRTGEITYIVESKRYTSAARGMDPALSFKKGDKVMIANIENAVSLIEPWGEDFTDPQYDGQTINVSHDAKMPESG